jgi:FixJ family two-component response regulator
MMSQEKPLVAVVDDDASVCRSIKRMLLVANLDAETFGSGVDFLARLEKMASPSFDCVVLDVHMPGMGGLEVQRRLVTSAPSLPVIFITAHDEDALCDEAFQGGAVAFLQKPFDENLFITTIDGALNRGPRHK